MQDNAGNTSTAACYRYTAAKYHCGLAICAHGRGGRRASYRKMNASDCCGAYTSEPGPCRTCVRQDADLCRRFTCFACNATAVLLFARGMPCFEQELQAGQVPGWRQGQSDTIAVHLLPESFASGKLWHVPAPTSVPGQGRKPTSANRVKRPQHTRKTVLAGRAASSNREHLRCQ